MPTDDKDPKQLTPQVTLTDAAHGLGEVLLTKTPIVSAIVAWVRRSERARSDRRTELWATAVETDAPDLAARIAKGLDGPDEEFVRAGVVEAMRAVTDAVDDAAVPAIGKLTAYYLRHSDVGGAAKVLIRAAHAFRRHLVTELERALDNARETPCRPD